MVDWGEENMKENSEKEGNEELLSAWRTAVDTERLARSVASLLFSSFSITYYLLESPRSTLTNSL